MCSSGSAWGREEVACQRRRGRWLASDASATPMPASVGEVAELVEVPLAQTGGEGITKCELLR